MAAPVPPRPTDAPLENVTTVPLGQLWTRLPETTRKEVLVQLARILNQRLSPPPEEADDD